MFINWTGSWKKKTKKKSFDSIPCIRRIFYIHRSTTKLKTVKRKTDKIGRSASQLA